MNNFLKKWIGKANRLDKFWRMIIFSFIIVALIAVLDIVSMKSGLFAQTPSEYVVGNFHGDWWGLFKWIALIPMFLFGLIYYFVVRQDKSEAIAVPLFSYIIWRFGVADVLFFLLQGKLVQPTLPWLTGNYPMQYFANIFSNGIMTNVSLYISAIVGILIALGIAKFLKEKL